MFSALLQSVPALCFLQVPFFFFSQAAKHIFIETYSRQSASQNYHARVKAASQMLCKYHIFISSLCFATFKHVCGRSAAPSGDRLDAEFQAACVNVFLSFQKDTLFIHCFMFPPIHNTFVLTKKKNCQINRIFLHAFYLVLYIFIGSYVQQTNNDIHIL